MDLHSNSATSVLPRVAALFVHPIKSTAPIAVDDLVLDERGAVGDRRWMVVDTDDDAVTARDHSALALVHTRFAEPVTERRRNSDGALWVSASGMNDLLVSIPEARIPRTVRVWDDQVDALDAGDEAAQWFSDVIGRRCRLVRLAEHSRRPLAARFAGPVPWDQRAVAFTDGAPLLILGQSSVDALSARIVADDGEPMVVRRFRPNVLLAGTMPHEEDTWTWVRIGSVDIGVGSPCKRCVFTTINPDTGHRGVEPLRTLATYRRDDGHVLFGMNATHAAPGVLHVGDGVKGSPQ